MTLSQLWEQSGLESPVVNLTSNTTVGGVVLDSRIVEAGDLFVAVPGENADGASFAAEACQRGAVAVVAQSDAPEGLEGMWLKVENARHALARLSACFYGYPSHELLVVGITGTNGKTTTTYLMDSILEEGGVTCGRISSVSYRVGSDEQVAQRTTPEAPELQAMMRQMVNVGCRACVMEVSSHALDLHRTDTIRFGAAVFTNLTREHLDYHGDMPKYFAAKRRLFHMIADEGPAIINVDDPYGRELSALVDRPVTYSLNSQADVYPERLKFSLDGVEMDVRTARGMLRLSSSLLGRNNAYNLLSAAATAVSLSLPLKAIERGLAKVDSVPGRMEVVSGTSDDISVIVDFAHTDDALKGLLETVRSLARRRVITVFGCGGDRDKKKRSLMGTVAGRLSDRILITSDNPRSEDPVEIAQEIELGLRTSNVEWTTVLDRGEAIERAVCDAEAGDLVVVAGKGHECYQVFGERLIPFEDSVVAKQALSRRRTRLG